MSLPWRFRGGVLVAVVLAAAVPAEARSSELIARNATGVRLQADAQGRALISFRSEGQSRQLLAWGAIDARPPSQTQPQVAFKLQYGGSIGPNVCGAYRGPPLAWKVAACTATDGSHWALQAWQRMLPNYGVAASGDRAAWELRLSHWSGPVAKLELWTDWSYRRFHHLYGRLTHKGAGVYGFRSTRLGCRWTRTDGTSSSTRSAARTGRAGSGRTASSPTSRPVASVTASTRTGRTPWVPGRSTARR